MSVTLIIIIVFAFVAECGDLSVPLHFKNSNNIMSRSESPQVDGLCCSVWHSTSLPPV